MPSREGYLIIAVYESAIVADLKIGSGAKALADRIRLRRTKRLCRSKQTHKSRLLGQITSTSTFFISTNLLCLHKLTSVYGFAYDLCASMSTCSRILLCFELVDILLLLL